MGKYTKEQWTLSVNEGWSTNPYSVVVRKRGVHSTTVANLPERLTISPEERWANAQLITLAPQLLEVLKEVVAWIDAPGDSAFSDAQLAKARVLLSLAQGEKK